MSEEFHSEHLGDRTYSNKMITPIAQLNDTGKSLFNRSSKSNGGNRNK